MIRIENVSKSNSNRILYIEASAALNRGEKIGLVGPNGAGKTTSLPHDHGEEQPDEGQISTEKGRNHRLFRPGCRRNVRPLGGRGGHGGRRSRE